MNVALAVLAGVLGIFLILVRGTHVRRTDVSTFELRRRVKLRDQEAIAQSEREGAAPVLLSLRRSISLLLLFALLGCVFVLFGVVWEIIIAIVLSIWGPFVEQIPLVRKSASYFYEQIESRLITFVRHHPRFFRIVTNERPDKRDLTLASREEFLYVLEHKAAFFDERERNFVLRALELSSQNVGQVMTKSAHVKSIKTEEILGPLVLDELYKTGEKSFIVISRDIDHPVGILNLDRLTNLHEHRTPNALSAMEPHIETVERDTSLEQAMNILLETKLPLLIVRDNERTVGIISLEMIVRTLLQRD